MHENKRIGFVDVITTYLPTIRSMSARMMREKYKMDQKSIAAILGVSQAEVSKYLNLIQPKIMLNVDSRVISRFIHYTMKEQHTNAQKVVCAACPKGAALSCSLMVK